MWDVEVVHLGPHAVRCRPLRGGQPVSYAEVIEGWAGDADFRSWHSRRLADSEFSAFRWETPPIARRTSSQVMFEFVLLKSDSLERPADRHAFAENFAGSADTQVVAFSNLGGDAELVAPCPVASDACYCHLATFLRRAPAEQVDSLWSLVGRTMQQRLARRPEPVWLSTAGMGVAWLHVRLDSRPKYYGHAPYKDAQQWMEQRTW
jgi:hypothetical protein